MSSLVEYLDKRYYPDVTDNWDDTLFRGEILKHIGEESVALDLGAGAGIVGQMNFRGVAGRICGIDLDPRVAENPFLDEGQAGDGANIPYSDSTFDVVFSDNVLEHLDEPEKVFSEVFRVLKPSGKFLFKTPNKTHYMPLISRFTPHWFHAYVNRLRGRAEVDTFRTRYLANNRKDVLKLADYAGFEVDNIELIEGRPEYTRIFWGLYLFGICYERIVNSSAAFRSFRILLVGTLAKPG